MGVGIGENNSSPGRSQRDLLLPLADDENETQKGNMISKGKSKNQNQGLDCQIQCAHHRAEKGQVK